MDVNKQYFIKLLSGFVNKEKVHEENDIDWLEVYKLARIHNVTGIIYLMVKNQKYSNEKYNIIVQNLNKDFAATMMISAEYEHQMDILIQKFKELQVPHVFLKGYFIKNYYPVKDMRTMGDIDILIKQEDREKTDKILKNMGYEPGIQCGEVWDYIKGLTHLELHSQIVYQNLHNDQDYISYFSDAWNHVNRSSETGMYELESTYHFIFLMVHLAKHMDSYGCGIRMIMDIAVYLQRLKEQLDWNQISEAMDELNLRIFSNHIFILCKRWFQSDIPQDIKEMEETFYQELCDYVLSAGTFGFYNRNLQAKELRNEYLLHKSKAKGLKRFTLICSVIRKSLFPGYKRLCDTKRYSFIKNKPYLLPLGWGFRILYGLVIKSKASFTKLILLTKSKEESEKQFAIITKLGLSSFDNSS